MTQPDHASEPMVRQRADETPDGIVRGAPGSDRPATFADVPFLVGDGATAALASEDFAWPVRFPDISGGLETQANRYLALAAGLDDVELRNVVLGSISLLVAMQTYLETAVYLQAAAACGQRFVDQPPEAEFLAGGGDLDTLPPPFSSRATAAGESPPLSRLREIKIAAQWNRRSTLRALVAPQIVAITTNSLVKQAALAEAKAVRFRFIWNVFNARRQPGPHYRIDCRPIAEAIADLAASSALVSGAYADRLRQLVRREAELALSITAANLSRLSGMPDLPSNLWSGTGGYYPSRLIGLEVMRRGGNARRFGHGLNAGILYRHQKPFRIAELAVSSQFTVPTKAFAELMDEERVLAETPEPFRAEILWGQGDPHFRTGQPGRVRTRSRGPVRVLYAPTPPRGFRQYLSPQLPDAVYRNWQFRLIEMLSRLPIELVCTLHPREREARSHHPAARFADVAAVGFEDLLQNADVVLFDYLKSTTVALALPSDKPVVVIDLERLEFEPVAEARLQERCRIIRADYDERGRPAVDERELEDALCAHQAMPDPSYFRRLYVGDGT